MLSIREGSDEYIWRKSRELYEIASEVSKMYCAREDLTIEDLRPYELSGEAQAQNACLIRKMIRETGSETTYDGFFKGTDRVPRLLDPFRSLTTSLDSAYGVVALAGLQKSVPFMIVKYVIGSDVIPCLYELTLGMILNRLRYEIPNIMYTYAGLYCSPPVDPRQTTKAIMGPVQEEGVENCILYIEEHIGISLPEGPILGTVVRLLEKYIKGKVKLEVLLQSVQRRIVSELISYHPQGMLRGKKLSSLLKETEKVNLLDVGSTYTENDDISSDIDVSVGDESSLRKDSLGDSELDEYSEEEYRAWKRVVMEMLYRPSFMRGFKEELQRARRLFRAAAEKASDFNAGMMCHPDRPMSVIIFAEAVPNPTSLYKFLYQNPSLQEEDAIQVWAQLVFALNVGWQRVKFSHNDLHANNVLIRTLSSPIRVSYPVLINEKTGETRKVTVESRYIPVLIDLGMARAEYRGKTYGYYWKRVKEVVSKNTKDVLSVNTLFTLAPSRIKTERYKRLQQIIKKTILRKPLDLKNKTAFDQLPVFSGSYYGEFIREYQR